MTDYCQCMFDLPILNPQSAFLELFEIDPEYDNTFKGQRERFPNDDCLLCLGAEN